MTIAEVVATYLTDTGTTEEQMAYEMSVTQATINRWSRGETVPKSDKVSRLTEVTGLPEARIVDAIHRQRLRKPGVEERLARLEDQVAEIVARLRS